MLISAGYAVEVRSPIDEASAIQNRLHAVIERSSPSVFAVTAILVPTADPDLFRPSLEGQRFAEIAQNLKRSCGTAFAIDSKGYLLTNEHVVSGAQSVWITTDAGITVPALVVGTDPRSDLAVLKIPIETMPMRIGAGSTATHGGGLIRRGDLVVTIGNPGGIASGGEMAASVGCISAVNRSLPTLSARENRFYSDLLQITTPITMGSSGGPLVDLDGRAIGMVCAVAPSDPSEQNIGFAIALSPSVMQRVDQLRSGQEAVYGYIGVNVSRAEPHEIQTYSSMRPEPQSGARVDHVTLGAPADGVLKVGDLILAFDGQPIRSDIDFIRMAGSCRIDQDVPLTILRDENRINLTIRPRRRELPTESISHANQSLDWAGVTFINHDAGVSVKAVAESASTPLEVGSIVTQINDRPIANLRDLLDALHAYVGEALDIEIAE